jgi:dihydroorotate dehydrogenase (fumarate)
VRYAKLIESAGADALELNVYDLPADPAEPAADIEDRLVCLVRDVCGQVQIPVAVKLTPYFTAPAHLARRLASAGAEGLVLFNRFSQPERYLPKLGLAPRMRLSGPDELPLRLHWAALLFGRVRADLAVTGGVGSARDVAKAVMAGAAAVQIASALYRRGIDCIAEMLAGLRSWLEGYEFESVRDIHGILSSLSLADPTASQRANHARLLNAEAR